jgi:methylase of polypeptide subunit release factors
VSSSNPSTNESKHSTRNPLLRFALKRFFASVNGMMPGIQTIFDAGCGEGYGAQAILKQHSDIRIIGVDLSLEALRRVPAQARSGRSSCVRSRWRPVQMVREGRIRHE